MATTQEKTFMRPCEIAKCLLRIQKGDVNTRFILPNNYIFELENSDWEEQNDKVVFYLPNQRVFDELHGRISSKDIFTKRANFSGFTVIKTKEYQEKLSRTTAYSDHSDYQPDKRILIHPITALTELLEGEEHRGLGNESVGHIRIVKNFVFIPSNGLIVRFSKKAYLHKSVNASLYNRAKSSVMKQTMTARTTADTAALLSTIQLFYLNFDMKYESCFAMFGILFDSNVHDIVRGKKINFSLGDVWQALAERETIFMPIAPLNTKKNYVKPFLGESHLSKLDDDFKLIYTEDFFLGLVTKHLGFRKQEELSVDELVSHYNMGSLNAFSDVVDNFEFFNRETVPKHIQTAQELDDGARILKFIVEDRFLETDMYETFRRLTHYMLTLKNETLLRRIIAKLSTLQVTNWYHPGLNNQFVKPFGEVPEFPSEDDVHYSKIEFINTHLQIEKKICKLAQMESNAWGKVLGLGMPVIFDDADYILKLAKTRRTIVKVINKDDEEDEEEEAEELSLPKRILEKMRIPVYKCVNLFNNIETTFKNTANLDARAELNKLKEEVMNQFNSVNMPRFAATIRDMQFDSIGNSITTIKALIGTWFSEIATKICSLFGVDYKPNIDPAQLFFYYLVWVKNDCLMLRWYIVIDVLATLGILDAFLSVLRKVYSCISHMFAQNIGEEFENFLTGFASFTEEKKVEAVSNVKKLPKLSFDEEGEGWLNKILSEFGNATPALLGVAGTALLGVLGYKVAQKDKSSVGDMIVQGARNIGFLSLGLAAVPKIFQNIMKVIYWATDYIKLLTIDGHKTQARRIEIIQEWLKETVITEGVTQNVIVRDINLCFKFLRAQNTLTEIEGFIDTVDDPALKIVFRQRATQFNGIIQLVHSAMRMILPQREVFHLQLYSELPGVGKTDLANAVIKKIQNAVDGMEWCLFNRKGAARKKPVGDPVYPINEYLNHVDNYYGQAYGYMDEDNVFSKTDPQFIVNKLTLLTGTPLITQQAALNNKGRLFAFKALVSNTNNAYHPPDGMLRPQALFRRRELFKVEVKPEYLTNNVLDDKKCKEINRTAGEHLTVTWQNPLEDEPKNSACTKMEVADFLRLVEQLTKKQIAIEEIRLSKKNAMGTVLRGKFEEILEDMEGAAAKAGEGGSTERISLTLQQLRRAVTELEEADLEKNRKKRRPHLKENLAYVKRDLADLENLSPYLNPDDDAVVEQLNEIETINFLSFHAEATQYRLDVRKNNGKTFYTYVPGKATMRKGDLDHSYFKIDKVDGEKRIIYNPPEPLSIGSHDVLLWHLLNYAGAKDESSFRKMKSINLKLSNAKVKAIGWKNKIKASWESMSHVLASLARWINDKIIARVGEGLVMGLSAAVGVFALFFSLAMVGQFLAPTPEPISYNQRVDKHNLFKSTTPKVISSIHEDNMHELAMKSTYKLYYRGIVDGQEINIGGTIIGVKGSIFLVNKHTLKGLKRNTKATIYDHTRGKVNTQDGLLHFDIGPKDVVEIPDSDAALIRISGFRPLRSIHSHFVSEEDCVRDMENMRMIRLSSVVLREDRKPTASLDYSDSKRNFQSTGLHDGHQTPYNLTGVEWKHSRVFEFSTDEGVVSGQSGSLVIHDNTCLSGRFLGILIAKKTMSKSAYCGVITKEMIEKALVKFEHRDTIVTTVCESFPLDSEHPLYEVFDLKSEVSQSPLPSQAVSRTSGYKKSKIHGVFEVESTPAIQDIRDPRIEPGKRHFMKVSLNKTNGIRMPYVSREEEEWMVKGLVQVYTHFVPNLNKIKVYGTRQAITGIRAKGSTSINTKTSAGLPYKMEKGVVGKSPFIRFDVVSDTYQISERVHSDVAFYKAHYNIGQVPQNQKLEFRKKELVGHNKIIDPKTRTVATGNFIHQILYNECFKDLMTFVKNVWNQGRSMPFALGVDPERHWNQVAEHLQFHDYVMDFDVKAWESKVSLQMLLMTTKAKLALVERAYQSRGEKVPDISRIAYGLAVDFTDADVIFEDVMYHKQAGLLSGHPGTFIENSEIHVMIILIICRRILLKTAPEWANVGYILQHVKFILAADDVVIAVSKSARRFININTIVDGYKELGFELTAPDKSDVLKATTLEECQFLKNHFKKRGDVFHAIPNMSIITQLLNWIREDTALTPDDQFQTNLHNAFRFAWWRGEEEYEQIRETTNIALFRHGMSWPYTYSEMAVLVKMIVNDNIERAERENPIGIVEDEVYGF